MGDFESKLAGVDQALAELGKTEHEASEVRDRYRTEGSSNLGEVDAALSELFEGVPVGAAPETAADSSSEWEQEDTEIEVVEESDFVLLVDENDLDALERVGEEDAQVLPAVAAEDAQDDGFFKKLFGNRGSRPPQAS